ncbi:MAG: hypothetical protein N2504_03055 [candidate division WOR-3 bacterium]|nr:hypothetical protein [candidate division WOR-3 bacterium]MCX7947549.1 hypothetical protein [candidate division WOR-3 bacterium]MDW8150435.1 hypothetical protein [candidate division WOR-3 bacterium]
MVKAQVSIYSFENYENLGETVREFWNILKSYRLNFISNSISTIIWSDDGSLIFEVLKVSFEKFKKNKLVFDIKILNFGPYPDFQIKDSEI